MNLQANDVLNGAEGIVTCIIDERVIQLGEVRNITATLDLNKSDVKILGKRIVQHKITGASGSGSMNVYYLSSRWAKMAYDYVKNGTVTVLQIIVKNSDPASEAGTQTIKLSGVKIDGTDLAKLDIDTEALDQDVNFTFEDFDIINEFNTIS